MQRRSFGVDEMATLAVSRKLRRLAASLKTAATPDFALDILKNDVAKVEFHRYKMPATPDEIEDRRKDLLTIKKRFDVVDKMLPITKAKPSLNMLDKGFNEFCVEYSDLCDLWARYQAWAQALNKELDSFA